MGEESGGVSAVHIKHRFDHEVGTFGIRIGDYEKNAMNALRKRGHNVTLESEIAPKIKKPPFGGSLKVQRGQVVFLPPLHLQSYKYFS